MSAMLKGRYLWTCLCLTISLGKFSFHLMIKKRPKLPTLSDNEYGYENIWVK